MSTLAMSVEVTAAWIADIGPIVAGVVGGILVAWLGFRASRKDQRRERQASLYDTVLNRATYRKKLRENQLTEANSTHDPHDFLSKLAGSFSPEWPWYGVEARFRAFASCKVVKAYSEVTDANEKLAKTAAEHLDEASVADVVKDALQEAIKADDALISAITQAYDHCWSRG